MNPPLTLGNSKIDKSVAIFNLPPVKSCPNCASCSKTCYALKAYRMYPNVRTKYDYNYNEVVNHPSRVYRAIVRQLESSKIRAVRIHASGDFFDVAYVRLWSRIAKRFPGIRFYAYTKARGIVDLSPLDNCNNVNLIESIIDGKLNYGPMEYVKKLNEEVKGSFICPAGRNKDIHCGKNCNYCIRGKFPLFIQH